MTFHIPTSMKALYVHLVSFSYGNVAWHVFKAKHHTSRRFSYTFNICTTHTGTKWYRSIKIVAQLSKVANLSYVSAIVRFFRGIHRPLRSDFIFKLCNMLSVDSYVFSVKSGEPWQTAHISAVNVFLDKSRGINVPWKLQQKGNAEINVTLFFLLLYIVLFI